MSRGIVPQIPVCPDVLVCAVRGALGLPTVAAVEVARAVRDNASALGVERADTVRRLVAAWLDGPGKNASDIGRAPWLTAQRALRGRYPHLFIGDRTAADPVFVARRRDRQ